MHRIATLCIGSEILDGRILETNSNWIINALKEAGYSVGRTVVCDDDTLEIIASIKFLFEAHDLIIISGGIGPTSDDLTREAISELTGSKLVEDSVALANLTKLYSQKRRELDATNRKQALIPSGATLIPNYDGTAAGFIKEVSSGLNRVKYLVSLPGVPHELYQMFKETVIPFISKSWPITKPPPERVYLKVFGLPESVIGDRVQQCSLPPSMKVSYRAVFPEIHLSFSGEGLDKLVKKVKSSIGEDYIFSDSLGETFESALLTLLKGRGLTVSFAESCTGGMVSSLFTDTAGASTVFLGAVVSYSNEAKSNILKVPAELIRDKGAVSSEVAKEMARGVREILRSDIGVSITGIAGPDGGSKEKPVGTFFVGLATKDKLLAFPSFFHGTRPRIRRYCAYRSMDVVRRLLLGLDLPEHV